MPKINPCLWFANEAEEAANFYVSLLPDSRIKSVTRYPEGTPGLASEVMLVDFEFGGVAFMALNGRPAGAFNEAVSFQILTDDQSETDRLWEAFTSNGGEESMCSWCKDRFGVSWQVTPRRLIELMTSPDKAKAGRVAQAMMQMRKIDIAKIEAAAEG